MEARSSLTQDCSRIFLGRRDFGLLVAGFTRAEGSAVDGSVLETSGLGSGRCSGFVSGPGVILAGGADAADEEGPQFVLSSFTDRCRAQRGGPVVGCAVC